MSTCNGVNPIILLYVLYSLCNAVWLLFLMTTPSNNSTSLIKMHCILRNTACFEPCIIFYLLSEL